MRERHVRGSAYDWLTIATVAILTLMTVGAMVLIQSARARGLVKALLARPKVLLLDEPTTALGPEDVERLHALVFEQSRAGVGIVYVSHRLPEVLGIADRVTVLRDGVSQGTFEARGMSEDPPAA